MDTRAPGVGTVKTSLAEAAWWLFWTFVLMAGAIRQVRDGGTWIPAGSVVIGLWSFSNFLRVAARLRARSALARVREIVEEAEDLAARGAFIKDDPYEMTRRLKAALDQ